MANNIDLIGETAALYQILKNDFTATNGVFEDEDTLTIGSNHFRARTNLVQAIFPNVTIIQSWAFHGCNKLTNIIAPKVTQIKGEAFDGTKLQIVNFPLVTKFDGDSVFKSTTNLKKAYFPKLETIVNHTFNGSRVCFLDLGNLVHTGNNTFISNTYLQHIILRKTSAITTCAGVGTFNNTRYATTGAGDAYIYVPRDLISTYQSATNWASLYAAHSDMFRPLEDYTVDGTTTGEFDESMIATPQTPLYAVTNEDVSPDANHPRTITTTTEGHITFESGVQSSEAYASVYINNTSVSTSQLRSFLTVPAGSTVKVIIQNMTATRWASENGVRNHLKIRFSRGGADVFAISWSDLLETFDTNGLSRYEQTYTNTTSSSISIVSIHLYASLTSNNVIDFGIRVLIDGVRYV